MTFRRRLFALCDHLFRSIVVAHSHRCKVASIAALLLSLLVFSSGLAQEIVSADTLMEQGRLSHQQGAFTQALQYWTEAARRYGQDGRIRQQIKAQVSLSQALYQTGHYKEAGAVLTESGNLAHQIGDRLLQATVQGRLGTVLFALDENEQALRRVEEGLVLARELQHPALTATLLNDQGNILAAERRLPAAVAATVQPARTGWHSRAF